MLDQSLLLLGYVRKHDKMLRLCHKSLDKALPAFPPPFLHTASNKKTGTRQGMETRLEGLAMRQCIYKLIIKHHLVTEEVS